MAYAATAGASSIATTAYYDVVIIGGGWAGITAANTLLSKGKTNFTLLEARNYLGGRAITSFAFGSDIPVDLGCSWVHGIKSNPIQDLVAKYNVGYKQATYTEAVYFANSTRLSDTDVDSLYTTYWGDDYSNTNVFMGYQAGKQSSTNVDQSMQTTANGYISVKQMNVLQTREFNWLADTNIVQDYAADLSELSTWWWDSDLELSGGDTFLGVVGGGYSTVINKYAFNITSYAKLNTTVTNVDYSSTRVLVTYNTSGILKTISAAKVIVTLPLGVLKAGSVTFSPTFSNSGTIGIAKQAAITNLGMGILNKVALYWKNMTAAQVFWPKDREWIDQIADPGFQGNWTEWYNPYSLNGNKPVLIGFLAGNYAANIESLTDAQITAQAVAALRKLFNATAVTIPNPTSSLVTRWKTDKFSLGAYSFQKLGSKKSSRQDLAATISNKVYFAGEATNIYYPSTAHGAYFSGKTAACAVLGAVC